MNQNPYVQLTKEYQYAFGAFVVLAIIAVVAAVVAGKKSKEELTAAARSKMYAKVFAQVFFGIIAAMILVAMGFWFVYGMSTFQYFFMGGSAIFEGFANIIGSILRSIF